MKNGFSVLITLIAALLIAVSHPVFAEEVDAPSEDSLTGKLAINPEYIERLVLVDDQGHRKEFDKPTETLNLPPGRYRLQQVNLTGGYQCYAFTEQGLEWITVSPNEPANLKLIPNTSSVLSSPTTRAIKNFLTNPRKP